MAIMTHAKFHFNQLMLTLIFGIRASEPPPPPPPRGPGEQLKRPGVIGLSVKKFWKLTQVLFDVRARNSNLAKSPSEESNHALYHDQSPHIQSWTKLDGTPSSPFPPFSMLQLCCQEL